MRQKRSGKRTESFTCLLTGVVVVWCVQSGTVLAAEVATSSPRIDCRYDHPWESEAGAQQARGSTGGGWIPDGDVFRPILADPKQPQFFMAYQSWRFRNTNTSTHMWNVGFGENFGFYSQRDGCNGWQVGLLAGVFAQFDMDASSAPLQNADYVIGVPVSYRYGPWSTRVRINHQSSHLGDEFVIDNPGVARENLSYWELDTVLSYDYRRMRLYAGGGYYLYREPHFDRIKVQWGGELRGSEKLYGGVRMTPVLGADFKWFEYQKNTINASLLGGLEWIGDRGTHRFRLLLSYYYGYNPYGQFTFDQKVEMAGLGVYFQF